MNKSGLKEEYMVGLVVVVVIIIIMTIFTVRTLKAADKQRELSKCEQSIISNNKMMKLTKGERGTEIDCPTIYETLDSDNPDELKLQIAERMRRTWSTWQEGNVTLPTKATYCHPQYVLDFKHKDLKLDMTRFLIETPMPKENYTYMQYLSDQTNDEDWAQKMLQNPKISSLTGDVSTDTRKVILFYQIRDSDLIKEIYMPLAHTAEGVAVGAVSGGVILGTIGGIVCSPLLGLGTVSCAAGGAKAGVILGGAIGGFVGALIPANYPKQLSFTMLKNYTSQELKDIGCEVAPSRQTNK